MRFSFLMVLTFLASCSTTINTPAPLVVESNGKASRHLASELVTLFECSGKDRDKNFYTLDLLLADSTQEYIKIKQGKNDARFFVVNTDNKGNHSLKGGYEVNPRSGEQLDGSASILIPKILQNEGKAVIDDTKIAIKCSRTQTKPYHTN